MRDSCRVSDSGRCCKARRGISRYRTANYTLESRNFSGLSCIGTFSTARGWPFLPNTKILMDPLRHIGLTRMCRGGHYFFGREGRTQPTSARGFFTAFEWVHEPRLINLIVADFCANSKRGIFDNVLEATVAGGHDMRVQRDMSLSDSPPIHSGSGARKYCPVLLPGPTEILKVCFQPLEARSCKSCETLPIPRHLQQYCAVMCIPFQPCASCWACFLLKL